MPGLISLGVAVGADNSYAGAVTSTHDGDTVHVSVVDPLLSVPVVVTLRHLHPDKFAGRVDAQIITGAGVDVGPWLIARGFAVAWSGVGPKPSVPWPPPVLVPP